MVSKAGRPTSWLTPRSDFRAAALVCEGHSFRSTARHPLHNDSAWRHAYDLCSAKSFAPRDVESIIRVAASRSAAIISISITIAIPVVNADATGAEPQLQILRGRDRRRDRQPGYRGQADQYELKRFPHEFLPWFNVYINDNIAMRDLFLEIRGVDASDELVVRLMESASHESNFDATRFKDHSLQTAMFDAADITSRGVGLPNIYGGHPLRLR
ncbi:hypothetical protein FHS25_003825 [Rhizobium laguerreae]|uniref:Uncharacterized protein n=1 Tax=Rhizobium laguerreae TaxID=1076926 RepID=A0ABR6GAN2_9HYPH|nr:hypothetical protein [Rhizobium laguerreae]